MILLEKSIYWIETSFGYDIGYYGVNKLVSKYHKICKHTSYGEHKWFIKCIFDVDFNPHQGFIKVIKSLEVQHKWIDLYPGFV